MSERKQMDTVVILGPENIVSFFRNIKTKLNHPSIKKHSKNIGWMLLARIGTMIISFIATMYIARHLGPKNYGELSYAISFSGLFSFIASLGIDQILYRELIKFPENRNEILGSAIGLRLITASIAILICFISALIWSPKDVSFLLIILISFSFLFSAFNFLGYEFQADSNAKLPSLYSVAVLLVVNILKILTIYFDKGVLYLSAIMVIEPILYSISYIYIRTKVYGALSKLKFNKKIALNIFKDSLPLVFVSAFYMIYARIDQVFIKNMIGSESVGLYDSAVRISELWFFIPNIIIAGLFPPIINAQKSNRELYYSRTKKLFIIISFIAVTTSLSTVMLSEDLIRIVFGDKFIAATIVLQIYVLSNIGAALNQVSHQILIAENLTKMIIFSSFIGMATNVILCILLIGPLGMKGAALASLVSYSIQFIAIFALPKSRKLFVSVFKSSLKISNI